MVALLRLEGCGVKFPIDVPPVRELRTADGKASTAPIIREANLPMFPSNSARLTNSTVVWEFKNICIPHFIESFDTCWVRNLQDIVVFNEENKEMAMPPREYQTTCLPGLDSAHTSTCNSIHRAERSHRSPREQFKRRRDT